MDSEPSIQMVRMKVRYVSHYFVAVDGDANIHVMFDAPRDAKGYINDGMFVFQRINNK